MSYSWLGSALATAGRTYDYLTPGAGTSTLTNAGRAIKDPGVVYTGGVGGLFNGKSDFTPVNTINSNAKDTTDVSNQNPGDSGQVLGTSTSGTGYYGDYTSADVANLQNQVSTADRLLASLGLTRDTSLSNIKNSYDQTRGRAMNDQQTANRGFNTQTADNESAKASAMNRINTTAENRFRSAMGVLGAHGAGISSAARYNIPTVISQQATADRGDQINTYGKNARSIDEAQKASDEKYKRLFEDLLGNYNKDQQSIWSDFYNNENSLNSQKASAQSQLDYARGGTGQAAYTNLDQQLAAAQNAIDNLTRQYAIPAYNYTPVDTAAPSLSQYTTDQQAVDGSQLATDPTATDVNSYLPWILRDKQLGLL